MRLIAERVLQPLNTAVVLPYEQRVYMEGEIVRQVKGKPSALLLSFCSCHSSEP